MKHQRKPLTPEQVRARFFARGETFAEWARKNGFSREAVSAVLNGTNKGRFGTAHEIAVALGLKVPDPESTPSAAIGNTQLDAAA